MYTYKILCVCHDFACRNKEKKIIICKRIECVHNNTENDVIQQRRRKKKRTTDKDYEHMDRVIITTNECINSTDIYTCILFGPN